MDISRDGLIFWLVMGVYILSAVMSAVDEYKKVKTRGSSRSSFPWEYYLTVYGCPICFFVIIGLVIKASPTVHPNHWAFPVYFTGEEQPHYVHPLALFPLLGILIACLYAARKLKNDIES
jgi:hypothetical protein